MRLIALLVCALLLAAQTTVPIQNANFQSPVAFTAGDGIDQWETGTVPGWTVTGKVGVQLLAQNQCGPTAQFVFSGGGTVTQDLGQQPAGTYTLTVGICNRADGVGSGSSYTVSLGSCSQSALNSTIAGVQTVSLPCTVPAGDLQVSLSCSAPQCNFASVAMTTATPPPPPPPPKIDTVRISIAPIEICASACDGTDDTPETGSVIIQQPGLGSQSYALSPTTGISNVELALNASTDPLPMVFSLSDATGSLTYTVTQGVLSAAFVNGNFPVPSVRIQKTSAGIVFRGFVLP